MLRIAGVTNESIVDGIGIRQTIFVQGCKHNCRECHNPETHDFNNGKLVSIDELIANIIEDPLLDGVTFSGGDPMEQPIELAQLAEEIHKLNLDVWCYTGYTFDQCLADNSRRLLLKNCDILIDGKFNCDLKTLEKPFVGSSNQRIINIQETLRQGKIIELEV